MQAVIGWVRETGAPVEHVCNRIDAIASDYILLAHYGVSDKLSGPLSEADLRRVASAKNQAEFDAILASHPCNGSWPIAGPAAKKVPVTNRL